MFLIKKIISAFLLPPGCFIALLVGVGFWQLFRHRRLWGLFTLVVGLLLWGLSLAPVASYLIKGLERDLTIPARLQGDVIILLGGGASDDTRDLTGTGAPSDEMMARLVTAVRLQRRTGLPIIVSGGAPGVTDTPEAVIAKRFLLDLGVPQGKVIMEERSRDTGENARYSAEICSRKGYKHPLLVTSAYHMKRSLLLFRRSGLTVTPLPAAFRYGGRHEITPYTLLPSVNNLSDSAAALHERLGLLFYRLTLQELSTAVRPLQGVAHD